MDAQPPKRNDAILREMYRKSNDKIRVYNPTDKDYILIWDKFKHLVPNRNKDIGYGKGMKVFERFLAEKYAREIKNQMINEMADKRLRELEDKLIKAGNSDPLVNANLQLERGNYKTDNPELTKKIFSQVWLGVEEEYGLIAEEKTVENDGTLDTRTMEEQLLDTMDKRYTPTITEELPQSLPTTEESLPAAPKKYSINKSKKKLIEEVSV